MSDTEPSRVLFVCTANQCRSPLGEVLLRAQLKARTPDAVVDVSSAGVSATAGTTATSPTIDAASTLRVDLSAHRSVRLEAAQVRAADLVIGMERRHVQEAVLLDPSAFTRSFTLKELVRRGRAVGRRGYREPLADWAARVSAGRRPIDLLGASRDDDIDDPTTNPMVAHQSTALEIDELVGTVVELVWNPLGLGAL